MNGARSDAAILCAEFNEKLIELITDDIAIDHEMEHEWEVDVEDDTPF